MDCCCVLGSLPESGVIAFLEKSLVAEYGVEELGDDTVEMAGGEAIGVVDQQFQLAEVDLLDGAEAVLKGYQPWVICVDGGRDWAGVDIVFNQCFVAASNFGRVVGAFVDSCLDIVGHNRCWPGSRTRLSG